MKLRISRGRIRRLLTGIGMSRHGALSVFRRASVTPLPFATRATAVAAGSSCIGTGVAFLVQSNLGLSGYDVLSSAISSRSPLTLGQSGWALAFALFAVAAALGRRPGPWGVIYIIGNGLAVDAASGLLNEPTSLPARLAFVGAGVVLMASGVSLVLDSGTTGGPFELLMLAGEDHGLNRIGVRYGLDGGVFILGVLLGGSFGVATIIHALTFGLVLSRIGQALQDRRVGRHIRTQARKEPHLSEDMKRHPSLVASGSRPG